MAGKREREKGRKSRENRNRGRLIGVTQLRLLQLYDALILTLPARWSREQFFFQHVTVRFIFILLFLLFFISRFQKIVFPTTRAHKTKSVLHARRGNKMGWWAPRRGGLPGHFDRANCLNPRALFAMLCAVPRRHSPLLCNDSLSRSVTLSLVPFLSLLSVATLFQPSTRTLAVAFARSSPRSDYTYSTA